MGLAPPPLRFGLSSPRPYLHTSSPFLPPLPMASLQPTYTSKRPIDVVLNPINRLLGLKPASGVLLFLAVVAAMIWVNSPWAESYHALWHYKLGLTYDGQEFAFDLHHWINDGLMAMFFFMVGLEIKREFVGGELNDIRKAALPIAAAVGGMVVPALLYLAINHSGPGADGWGVPMATDIAFTLGLVSLLGNRVPLALKVFLTALAIVDDLGSVLVIAFFYTSNIQGQYLLWAGLFLALLAAGNLMGIRSSWYYALIGIVGVWLHFLLSGVHATIAGVLAALFIPVRVQLDEENFNRHMKALTLRFDEASRNNVVFMTDEQLHVIEEMKMASQDALTPLQRIEHGLNPLVSFIVLPLFALANGGITLSGKLTDLLLQPVSLGIMAGLLLGKFVGIAGMSHLVVRLGWAQLPERTSWRHLYGAALMAGIGFTMSLFVSGLAFDDEELANQAKVGIMAASIIAGAGGLIWFRTLCPDPEKAGNEKAAPHGHPVPS